MTATAAPASLTQIIAACRTKMAGKGNDVWAVFFEDPGLQGPELTFTGVNSVANIKVGYPGWNDQIDGAIVGPNAVCRLYSDNNFGGSQVTFLPSEVADDLRVIGFHDKAGSLKLYDARKLQPPY
jgi:hypothetical protein